jgi:hypothetical protein
VEENRPKIANGLDIALFLGCIFALLSPVGVLIFGQWAYLVIISVLLFFSVSVEQYSKLSFFLICILILFKNFFILLAYNATYADHQYLDNRVLALSIDFMIVLMVFSLLLKNKTMLRIATSKIIIFYVLFIFLYFALGVKNTSIVSSLTYMRVYIIPIIAFFIGFLVGEPAFKRSILVLIFIYLSFLIMSIVPGFWELFSINNFFDIKYGAGRSDGDYLEDVDTTLFGHKIVRLIGPQLAPISTGYFLLFVLSFFVAEKWRIAAFFLLIPIFFSSKGCFVASLFLYFSSFISKERYFIAAFVIFYFAVIIYISSHSGLTSGYTHLLGLIGGFNVMIDNPLGNGIGFGGTQSSVKGVGYGGESGLGFVMSHFGVLGLGIYLSLLYHFYKSSVNQERRSDRVLYLSILIVLVNGILQEEALFMISLWWFFSWLGASSSRRYKGFS